MRQFQKEKFGSFFYLIYFLSVSFSGYPYSRWNTGSAGGAVTSVLMNGHALFNIIFFFSCLGDKMIATHYSYGFILKTDEEGEDSRNMSLSFKQTLKTHTHRNSAQSYNSAVVNKKLWEGRE